MPQLKSIFEKDLGRFIEGVIKADARDYLETEVEEYAFTNEVAQRLENFLEHYTMTQGINGSWISGFFGSGKSHLLKMLAILLDNPKLPNGNTVKDIFMEKANGNPILQGLINKAVAIPSDNILFNIDNKADLIARGEGDEILAVFLKVFNEHLGYYGKLAYMAQFERDLVKNGSYEKFKQVFEESAKKTWEKGRETPAFVMNHFTKAYQQATGQTEDGKSVLDRYSRDYKLSIEDFASLVKQYIDQKPANFRLNFFVDEIGQFIANDTGLMLNLQTIAESLSSQCHGRAWVIVTSQEAIDKIVGDMNAKQANDFSKIMARFSVRLPMSSQNVAEVIQMRLLEKNQVGATYLESFYSRVHANFGTLFTFSDGSQNFNNFRDQDHFINSFPFIPYQYQLFQVCLESLSLHNAFEGRNAAVGERSMLAVFQDVLKSMANNEAEEIATFDRLYEGIRAALKGQVIASIRVADENLPKDLVGNYAKRVLRALFLVKYYKPFKSTLHNITILMTDKLDGNIRETRTRVQEALNLLEQQSYIERNNDQYLFLTNEEKDVEAEIKNTPIEMADILEEIKNIAFGSIIGGNKIRHNETGQDFPFSKVVDSKSFTQEYELAIKVISPYYEHSADIKLLSAHSLGKSELDIILPQDSTLMQDLKLYKQTAKYCTQNQGGQNAGVQVILAQKGIQNDERHRGISKKIAEDIGNARILVMGEEKKIPTGQAQARVQNAFQILVDKSFTNLRMIGTTAWTESMVSNLLKRQPQLAGIQNMLSEPEQEILGKIQSLKSTAQHVTIKTIIDTFEKKPYGWSLAAIECILAKLFAADKLDFYLASTLLTDQTLGQKLIVSSFHPQVVIDAHFTAPAEKLAKLRSFFADFFAKPATSDDRALPGTVAQAISDEVDLLKQDFGHRNSHPILQDLGSAINTLNEHANKPGDYYLGDFLNHTDVLLDLREQFIEPIRNIYNGNTTQNKIYFDARDYCSQQSANFQQVAKQKVEAVTQLLNDPALYKNGRIPQLNSALQELRGLVDAELVNARQQAVEKVESYKAKLQQYPEFDQISERQKQDLYATIEAAQSPIRASNLISDINYRASQYVAHGFPELLTVMTEMAKNTQPAKNTTGGGGPISEQSAAYVPYRQLNILFAPPFLGSEQDVDDYLAKVRQALMEEINKGNRVNLG